MREEAVDECIAAIAEDTPRRRRTPLSPPSALPQGSAAGGGTVAAPARRVGVPPRLRWHERGGEEGGAAVHARRRRLAARAQLGSARRAQRTRDMRRLYQRGYTRIAYTRIYQRDRTSYCSET